MNRNTDVCDAAVERAATLLVHSMQAAEMPISQLSDALARMAQTLSDIGAPLFGQAVAGPNADVRTVRDAFKRDIAVCIESLQFHDRLMQQLTQARDVLAGLAPNKLLARASNMPANDGSLDGSIELF